MSSRITEPNLQDDDTEEIEPEDSKDSRPNSFGEMLGSFITNFDWYLYFVIALSFLFVISDTFIKRFMGLWEGAVEGDEPTLYGTMIQMVTQLLIVIFAKIVQHL